jgi:hypothetical protein
MVSIPDSTFYPPKKVSSPVVRVLKKISSKLSIKGIKIKHNYPLVLKRCISLVVYNGKKNSHSERTVLWGKSLGALIDARVMQPF